jgi:hypothetical protein
MIVSTMGGTCHTRGGGEELHWRSLARRGMLHSECESFDYVRVAPGTELALRGREGTESAWFVIAGSGRLLEPTGCCLRAGELLLLSSGQEGRLVGGEEALELLWLAVLPRAVSQRLPPRRPVA